MIHLAAMLIAAPAHREAAARPPAHIEVHRGDTLSAIAGKYHIAWPGLYEANRKTIGADPDLVAAGQRLRVPSAKSAAHLATLYRPPAATVSVPPAATPAAPAISGETAAPTVSPTYAAPDGSFQQCVISRESGGDSQVTNGSGHYGLYQFSYSAWVSAGGSPAAFGHASVGEQNQVFQSAYAQDGTSPWAPYDGC